MKNYYSIMEDIHEATKNGYAPLGKVTQIMEDMGEWAKAVSQKIIATHFFCPEDEENALSALGDGLLDMFNAFNTNKLKIEDGTSFQFGTVFNSEQQPVFTIHGTEFYSEDGKKYNRFSEIPVDVVVCYWYKDVPRGWFMKLTNYKDPKSHFSLNLKRPKSMTKSK